MTRKSGFASCRWFPGLWVLAIALFLMVPAQALGYGYGEVKADPLVESYKGLREALARRAMDWPRVEAQIKSGEVRKLITIADTDYKQKLSASFEKSLAAKDTSGLIDAYERTLYYLVRHKLDHVEANMKNFDAAKAIVNGGREYYTAVSPRVKRKDPEADKAVRKAFREALKSLGSPGAFGVGKQAADVKKFRAQKVLIEKALAGVFGGG